MKTTGRPEVSEQGTRDRVCRVVLERGPVTARAVGAVLGLTSAAVRRHLDGLTAEGLVTTFQAPAPSGRGRGRPPKQFVLTERGHAAMAAAYDDLAASALQFLEEVAGPDAVRRFATRHAEQLTARYRPQVEAAGTDPRRRADALATALSSDGYAASARPLTAGDVNLGVQLCQGHCPVQHVAARYPQLCEAETKAFSDLLGRHVQRLATLAQGDHVCTTHVPHERHEPHEQHDEQERTPR